MQQTAFPVLDLTTEAVQTYLIIFEATDVDLTDALMQSIATELQASRALRNTFRDELAKVMYARFSRWNEPMPSPRLLRR